MSTLTPRLSMLTAALALCVGPTLAHADDGHDIAPAADTVTLHGDAHDHVIEETVFFRFDEARLTAPGHTTVADVATAYHQADTPWDAVVLRGHADPRGPSTYNTALSWRRAGTVKDTLIDMGVPEEVIVLEAYGEVWPEVAEDAPKARYDDRRVELILRR